MVLLCIIEALNMKNSSRKSNIKLENQQFRMGHAASTCCAKDETPDAVEDIHAGSNRPSGATTQPAVLSDAAITWQSIDLTHSGSSLSLLRGIFLCKTLRGGGSVWRRKPANLTDEQLSVNFALSEPVRSLDVFLSHTWLTPGRWKFLSLLVRYGWPTMLVAWASGTALSCLFTLLGVLPLFYEWEFRGMDFPEVMSMGFWATLAGVASSAGGLLLSPYMCGKDRRCFLDCTCIDQTDEARMQEGIRNIGGFLQSAEELHVLWSAPYLTRLWLGCCTDEDLQL